MHAGISQFITLISVQNEIRLYRCNKYSKQTLAYTQKLLYL